MDVQQDQLGAVLTDASNYMLSDSVPEPPPSEHVPILVDRELPANAQAERTLLGAVLLDPQCFNEIAEKIEPQDFSLDSNRRIFQRMSDLMEAQVAVDVVTLIAELDRCKELEAIGGRAYVFSLTEDLPRRLQVANYINLVKEKSQLRQMISLFNVALDRAQGQADRPLEILEDAESQLLEIAQEANTGKLRSFYESVEEYGGVDPFLRPYTEPALKTGLQTGLVDLDKMTGGLQPSELTIIGARPSVGKSALAINIIENVCCGTGMVAALFSLEMSRASIERRFMASRARVDIKRAMEGFYLSKDEKRKLESALNDLVEARIFIDDSATLTPVQMRAKCRRLKSREKRLDLIVLDYVQLATAGHKTQTREQEIASISRSLKALAKETETPVLALAQLNRSIEQTKEKRPTLSSLRESGQLEQDGDLICFLHREEMYDRDNEDAKGIADLIVAKARNGPTGIVKLAYIAELTRFDNLARE